MLWLAAYLTGVPPVGLHALRCFCRGQAPDGSNVLLPKQLSSLELEQLLGSPLNLTVNPNRPFVPESCDNSSWLC